MANVNITTILEVSGAGALARGKHGAENDSIQVPKVVSVTGDIFEVKGSLTDASDDGENAVLWDNTVNTPTVFDFLYFWSDTDTQLQLIDTAGTSIIVPIQAEVPFILGDGDFLTVADATADTAEQSLVAIDKINFLYTSPGSGATAKYHLILVD